MTGSVLRRMMGLYSIEDGSLYPYTGNEEPIGLTSFEGDLFTADGSEYLLSGEDDRRYIYSIDSDGEKCSLSKVHTITDAQNIYGIMGVSGNHASMMNVKKGPVFVTFTDDGIEEERPDFAYPAEDAVFCVIRK